MPRAAARSGGARSTGRHTSPSVVKVKEPAGGTRKAPPHPTPVRIGGHRQARRPAKDRPAGYRACSGVRIDTEVIADIIEGMDDDGYDHIADVKDERAELARLYGLSGVVSLYSCVRCGSVVADRIGKDAHDRWHLVLPS